MSMRTGPMYPVSWLRIHASLIIPRLLRLSPIVNFASWPIWVLPFFMRMPFSRYVRKVSLSISAIQTLPRTMVPGSWEAPVRSPNTWSPVSPARRASAPSILKKIWWTPRSVSAERYCRHLKKMVFPSSMFPPALIPWRYSYIRMSSCTRNRR